MLYMVEPHSIGKVGVPVKAVGMSLNLNERNSTATVTLDDRADMAVKEITSMWFRDDDDPGRNMVWRARSMNEAFHSKTPGIQLEHIINVLRDTILFHEITPAMIEKGYVPTAGYKAGDFKDPGNITEVSAKKAIKYVLGFQATEDWILGNFDVDDVSQGFTFEGDSIYDALVTICSTLEDCWWEYSTNVYPFKLHIRQLNAETGTMMRPARNLKTITKSTDRSGMYTRFWPVGKDDLHLAAGYVLSKNATTYGVIDHSETDTSITRAEDLEAFAKSRLRKHNKPVVTLTVEGLELSRATGEPMDKISLGRMCQIRLAEYGTTLNERIIEMTYPDKINDPENVRITLSNKRDDTAKIISQEKKKVQKSTRVAARESKNTREILYNTVKDIQIVGPTNNKYTLQYQLVKDTNWRDGGNFSRAVAEWETSVNVDKKEVTVTAKPQDQSVTVSVQSVYNAGKNSVTVDTIQLASNYSPLGDNDLRSNIYIEAIASNGKKKDDELFTLTAPVKYANDTKNCVNFRHGDNIIGRVNIDSVLNQVTVTTIQLASNFSPLGDNDLRSNVYIEAVASNGNKKDDALFTLTAPQKYSGDTKNCVNLRSGNDIIGRVNIDSVLNEVTVVNIQLASNFSYLTDTETRSNIYIEAEASNGNKKTDGLFTLAGPLKYYNNTRNCVNLQSGANVLGRINIDSVLNEVTVVNIQLASNYSYLTDTDTRTSIFIEAEASNGNKKTDGLFTLASTTYNSGTMYCVNLQSGANVLGRVNVDSVYTAGRSSVTVTNVRLASNYSYLEDNETRTSIYIEGVASNGAVKNDALFRLASTTYDNGTKHCVNLRQGDNIIGRINVQGIIPTASAINIANAADISRSTTAPSGTSLGSLAAALVQAYQNTDGKGRYVRFKGTITGSTGEKWYYIAM